MAGLHEKEIPLQAVDNIGEKHCIICAVYANLFTEKIKNTLNTTCSQEILAQSFLMARESFIVFGKSP
jgi:hypothetical protein